MLRRLSSSARLAALAALALAAWGCETPAPPPAPMPTPTGTGTYTAAWTLAAAPVAGKPVALSYTPLDAAGQTVADLDTVHERLSHLIVVSRDLATFAHVHAERREGGAFRVPYTFAEGGPHVLFADFTPKGGATVLSRHAVEVGGPAPAARPLGPATTVAEDRGVRARLTRPGGGLHAGTPVTLTFDAFDARGPITDLQPYLGAGGHVVVISEDATRFLHVHPAGGAHAGMAAMAGMDHGATASGDTATNHASMGHAAAPSGAHDHGDAAGAAAAGLRFTTTFGEAGRYKLWLQVQRAGVVYKLPFVLDVGP